MALLSKIFTSSTAVLCALVAVLFFTNKTKSNTIEEQKMEIKIYEAGLKKIATRIEEDSLNHANQLREMQSVMAQLVNQKKSVERENVNLRKGVRLDLLTIRQRRNGKAIDSSYTQAYKYLDK